jgi:hypothetical protein
MATRKADITSKVKFRTYPVRNERSVDITVVDAILATCASQPAFVPVSIGPRFRQQEYIGAEIGANNPCKDVISEAHGLFDGKRYVASLLSIGSGHPGIIPLSHGSNPLYQLLASSEETAQDVEAQMGHLGIHSRFSVSQGLQNDQIKDCMDIGHILSHTEVYVEDEETSHKIDDCVERLRLRQGLASLEQLSKLFTRAPSIAFLFLDHIEYSGGRQIPYKGLPPLTTHFVMRQDPWKKLTQFLDGSSTNAQNQKIMVVSGMGGCGKTQLVTKFMVEFKER